MTNREIRSYLRRSHPHLDGALATELNRLRYIWLDVEEAAHLAEVDAFLAVRTIH